MSGYTYSYRSRYSHPVFNGILEGAIWGWMCDTAAWKDCNVAFNGHHVSLKRGQIVTSRRFLMTAFRLTESEVRSLINRLTKDGMIAHQTTNGYTILTICNYEKYQTKSPTEHPRSAGETPTRNPNKKEVNEGNEGSNTPKPPSLPDWVPKSDWDGWVEMRKSNGKSLKTEKAVSIAVAKLEKLKADGHDPGEVLRESTINGWTSLYELKGRKNGQSGIKNSGKLTNRESIAAAVAGIR